MCWLWGNKGYITFEFWLSCALPTWISERDLDKYILEVVFAQQYILRKGLEVFGDKAEKATSSELQQIHDMEVYQPMDAAKLTKKERMEALSALMFIIEKSNG